MVLIILSSVMIAYHDNPISAGAKIETGDRRSERPGNLSRHMDRTITEGKGIIECETIGYSYSGEPIISWEITPDNYNKVLMLTFALHGFEDSWYQDGVALVEIAGNIVEEFSARPQDLQETKLIVIPCVNPDGTWNGNYNNGIGRCNAQGIDINRDFDYYWQYCGNKKYRTGKAPFSTPEARILRKMVQDKKPDIIIDFHGWLNCTYGDIAIAEYFDKAFGIERQSSGANAEENYMQQYFTGWGSQYARTLLVEYPDPDNYENMTRLKYSERTITVIKDICANI